MRSHLILNNFLIALVLTSYGSFDTSSVINAAPTEITETGSGQNNSLDASISLRTPTHATISFRSEGKIEENDANTLRKIPHLVLKRNGVPTPGFERTLVVSVDGLSIPKSGLFVDLTIETQHGDPDLGGGKNNIQIWHGVRFVSYSNDLLQSAGFTVTFNQTVRPGAITIQTPTDYYRYRLSLISGQGEKLQEIKEDYAFLLESQWRVPLPKVLEDSPEAAPNELLLYYCDMFPFRRDQEDPSSQLKRHEVEQYIQAQLVPAMVHAFEIQTNLWHMPWYREWTSYRTDESPKTLSVALGEHQIWYHGSFLYDGDALISIRVDGIFGEYSTLTDGILGVFHHELFHNQQRNIYLHFGGDGNLSGKDDAWKMFSEGTAVLASAVGQPGVEFARVNRPRNYVKRVDAFLGEDGLVGGGLNESYTEIPYHTAVYWRFLYEHCGGLVNGTENPSAGMEIIHHVLESLYSGNVVDIRSSSEAASGLPKIVDRALQQTPSCEFRTYEESLLRFSEAVFLLRTRNGRCTAAMEYRGCGFYDPDFLYPTPNAEIHSISKNGDTVLQGSIPSSYGIDLVELKLDKVLNHKKLRILIGTDANTQDQFNIEVWKIQALKYPALNVPVLVGEPTSVRTENGSATLEIDSMNTDEVSSLGIIITRLDTHEHLDSGGYSVHVMRK